MMQSRDRAAVILGIILLTLCYGVGMLREKALPGANAAYPLGWWGWFDQGQYLKSVRAFAHFDFTAGLHWYPLSYPLLGALFAPLMPLHPFLVVDLACLLASFAGFIAFARPCGFPVPVAVAAFLLGTLGSASVREDWIIPWTTTPASAVLWLFLGLCVCHLDARGDEPRRRRWLRIAWIGLLAASAPLFRPTDLIVPLIGLLLMAGWTLRDRTLRPGDILALIAGAGVVLLPYGLLYLRIYGPHPSQYMLNSRAIGFRFALLPYKTFVLLISPRPWFPFGSGMLQRLPWMAAGFAGMLLLPVTARGPARRGMTLLAATMLAYMALFFSYVDLLPSGLWLYYNSHYFKWELPGFALFGALLLRALFSGPRLAPILAVCAILLLSAIRLVPVPVADTAAPAIMLQFASAPVAWAPSYMGHERLADREATFENVHTMRVLPDSQGFRVLSLAQPFVGPLTWQDRSGLPVFAAQPTRWGVRIGYGWPCWLPPYPCKRMQPIP